MVYEADLEKDLDNLDIGVEGAELKDEEDLIRYYEAIQQNENVYLGDIHNEEVFERLTEEYESAATSVPKAYFSSWANEQDYIIQEIQAVVGEELQNKNYEGPESCSVEHLILEHRDHTQEVLNDRFGDKIPLYQKITQERYEKMNKGNELIHHPLESWTIDPKQAVRFKGEEGVIIRKEISVDQIWSSRITNPGFLEGEREVVVGSEGSREYTNQEIIESSEFDLQENAEWALETLLN